VNSKKRKNKNIHAGSDFDNFLKEEGIFEHCQDVGVKYAFVMQLQDEIKKQKLIKGEFAQQLWVKQRREGKYKIKKMIIPEAI
jgi:hypothetical protein